MHKQNLNNALHIGGSLETALNGEYQLNINNIVQESIKLTQKHFWQFLPATFMLIVANIALFLAALAYQVGEPIDALKTLLNAQTENSEATEKAIHNALFFSGIFSAPLYASASLMGLSHAIGFRSKTRHVLKGLTYSLSVIFAMGCITLLENSSKQISPLLGLFVGVSLSMTILLICEKRLSLFKALQISFRSFIKKIFPLTAIYLVMACLFLFCYATAGIALIWVLPFMFNIKGVLYREMFGVGIEVLITKENNSDEIFNA